MTIEHPTKILIAMDSFKGSLSALDACLAVARGLKQHVRGLSLDLCPLADGGEGTLDVLLAHWPGGESRFFQVMGPLPSMEVQAKLGWWPQRQLAVVEAAQACGLPLIPEALRQPLLTTTFGVGQLLKAAIDLGAAQIILCVGGSATLDGGLGAAVAMGWQALNHSQQSLDHGGGRLNELADLIPPPSPFPIPLTVWCDVRNPLLGPKGAAPVFGPQKGADAAQVKQVTTGLVQLEKIWSTLGNHKLSALPGGGAAGGLAAACVAFFNAKLRFGAEEIARATHLSSRIQACDWVIAGEGCFDVTSLEGKVVGAVAKIARRSLKPLAILAGTLVADPQLIGAQIGIAAQPKTTSINQAMANASIFLENAAKELIPHLKAKYSFGP